MTQEEALNTLMKMRAWRALCKGQKEEERSEMPEQKEVDEAFDVCIEMLSRSSISSNLDEAAEENSKNYYCSCLENHNETGICDGCENVKLAFKAGAEWMTGQGQTFGAHVDNGCAIASGVELPFVLCDTYEDEDVLKVQIRKK